MDAVVRKVAVSLSITDHATMVPHAPQAAAWRHLRVILPCMSITLRGVEPFRD